MSRTHAVHCDTRRDVDVALTVRSVTQECTDQGGQTRPIATTPTRPQPADQVNTGRAPLLLVLSNEHLPQACGEATVAVNVGGKSRLSEQITSTGRELQKSATKECTRGLWTSSRSRCHDAG